MMKKLVVASAAALMITAAGGGMAHATVFSGSATFLDAANGNDLSASVIPNSPYFTSSNNFTTSALTAGGSEYMTGFMTLKTTDSAGGISCLFGCQQTDPVSLTFAWSAPSSASNTAFGGDVAETTFTLSSFDDGSLNWSGTTQIASNGAAYVAQDVYFADGAEAEIDLFDTSLAGSTSALGAQFDVEIKDIKDPTKVPEPMSLALMGVGLIGIGMVRRRNTQRDQTTA